jgi:WD40 repeat protein
MADTTPSSADLTGPTALFPADPGAVPGYEIFGEREPDESGFVCTARQIKLNRAVALHLLPTGSVTADELARRRAEAEALAGLQHPNIVQVYEVGEAGGFLYVARELVSGASLSGRLDGAPWSATDAAGLVETLARAVHHAHSRGLVHRALTPGNVLLAENGTPKLRGFGPTALREAEPAPHDLSYRAPEQAGDRAAEVGPAADVYALGVLLYELLTGRPPFRGPTAADTLAQLASGEPVPVRRLQPRTPRDLETVCLKCLHREPRRRYPSAQALAEDLRRFLRGEAVSVRPPGAAARLGRWCRRQPAAAGLLATLVLALLSATALTAYFVGKAASHGTDAARTAEGPTTAPQDKDREDTGRTDAEDRARAEQAALALAARAEVRRRDLALADTLLADLARSDAYDHQGRERLGRVPEDLRDFAWHYRRRSLRGGLFAFCGHTGWVNSVCFSPDGSLLATGSWDRTARLWDARTGRQLFVLRGHTEGVQDVRFSPDGRRLLTTTVTRMGQKQTSGTARLWDTTTGRERLVLHDVTSADLSPDGYCLAGVSAGKARLWDARTGGEVLVLEGHTAPVHFVCFNPEGSRLATASADRTARLWDARTGRQLLVLPHPSPPVSVSCGADDSRLLTISPTQERCVRLWDGRSGKELAVLKGVSSAWLSPDGTALVTGGEGTTHGDHTQRNEVALWDARSGQQRAVLVRESKEYAYPMVLLRFVRFSPDGANFAAGLNDGTVRIRDTRTGEELLVLKGETGLLVSACFSPDGLRLATGSMDATARLWDARTAQPSLPLRGHANTVTSVRFSPDGSRLATASRDGTARLWHADGGQELLVLKGHTGPVLSVCFDPDGSRLVTASFDGTARVWDPRTGEHLLTVKGHRGPLTSACFSPDGRWLATASEDKTARLWDARTGKQALALEGHTETVGGICFSPDGLLLATGSMDRTARLWDARTGKVLHVLKGHTEKVGGVCFSPDGSRLATTSTDPGVLLWDVSSGRRLLAFGKTWPSVPSVCFSPDGNSIVTPGADNTVLLWDARTGQETLVLRGHTGLVTSVSFSPDGLRLASASADRTGRLWDARPVREPLYIKGGESRFYTARFSPDGTWIATGGGDGTVRLWDAHTLRPGLVFQGHKEAVNAVCFSPDSARLATAAEDKTVRLWDARTGRELLDLKGHEFTPDAVFFSPDGARVAARLGSVAVQVWDAATGKEVPGPADFADNAPRSLSPDGQRLALNEGDEVRLLDLSPLRTDEVALRRWATRPDPAWHAAEADRLRRCGQPEAAACQALLAAVPHPAAAADLRRGVALLGCGADPLAVAFFGWALRPPEDDAAPQP